MTYNYYGSGGDTSYRSSYSEPSYKTQSQQPPPQQQTATVSQAGAVGGHMLTFIASVLTTGLLSYVVYRSTVREVVVEEVKNGIIYYNCDPAYQQEIADGIARVNQGLPMDSAAGLLG